MNCQSIQSLILASEHPDRLAPEVERHLARCPACREVQQSLLRIEADIPTLPVPPSGGPVILFRTLVNPVIDTTGSGRFVPRPDRPRRLSEASRQKLALAFALAASLLVFAIGFWAWPRGLVPFERDAHARDTNYVRQRDEWLQKARTPRQRVEVLAKLGDNLIRRVRETEDAVLTKELAEAFQRLVEEDLLAEAALIPMADRPELLNPVADQLRQAESEASRLAAEQPRRAEHLTLIARSARKGDVRLRTLAGSLRS
jgi:hypothetical protein